MYAYIKGELAEINTDHIVIEAGGIGYQVFISLQTFDYLPSVGENLKIYTYLYLREDAMILYGFLTKDDLELFKLLISVSGIGPKGGLAILSTLEADDFIRRCQGDFKSTGCGWKDCAACDSGTEGQIKP